ncbi:hypothetical protein [Burkholderia pyrrocinia]|uniref:hypothetical protein n=1 Tax=Burkholderia pyrrocinia TaxID=60550 RepID=UPI002AB2E641|nr:hypothetical protein [Burkholderia pyrrocinia]
MTLPMCVPAAAIRRSATGLADIRFDIDARPPVLSVRRSSVYALPIGRAEVSFPKGESIAFKIMAHNMAPHRQVCRFDGEVEVVVWGRTSQRLTDGGPRALENDSMPPEERMKFERIGRSVADQVAVAGA